MQTQLIGEAVTHISFGKGIITQAFGNIVTVTFPEGEKRFLYPDAFLNFLTLRDSDKQKEITSKHRIRLQAERAVRDRKFEEQSKRHMLRNMDIAENSQAAFNIAPSEAERIICDASVSTGVYLSGYSRGKPRVPSRLKPNSACLLTGLTDGKKESDRLIFGAFMVNDDFWGERCKDGVINGCDRYKLFLAPEKRLSYWDYIEHGENIPRWGNVAFKYFSNIAMRQILYDMAAIFSGTEQEENAYEFCRYYCDINRLPTERGKDDEAV